MILSRFFRRKSAPSVKPGSPLLDTHYVFIKGVAYMRRDDALIQCDFRLPLEQQQWRNVPVPAGGDPQVVNICYALGLIEGAISMVPASPVTSRGHGLN